MSHYDEHLGQNWLRYLTILIALLTSIATTVAIGVHATSATTQASHSTTSQTAKQPFSVGLMLNSQGAVVFNPTTLSCYATIGCLNITNTTGQAIDLYLNGIFQSSMPPGGITGTTFNFPGTDIFTIPKTNPAAQLAVTVKPLIIPNATLKVNTLGKVVFSPVKFTCLYFPGTDCFTLTNHTTRTIRVYMNGTFYFTIYPNQVYKVWLNKAGKSIFTIPKVNRGTQLTVTGQ